MKRTKQTKFEFLNDLLLKFGMGAISTAQFWGQMERAKYGQADIDRWCSEYYARCAEHEAEVAGRVADQGR